MKTLVIAAMLMLLTTVNAQTKIPAPSKDFCTCWKASYEENNEKTKTQVYRSCSYTKFGPSMFRFQIEFFADGKCKYLHAGPSDNHYFVDGKWTYDKKSKKLTIVDDKDIIAYKFKFKEITNDVMKLTLITK